MSKRRYWIPDDNDKAAPLQSVFDSPIMLEWGLYLTQRDDIDRLPSVSKTQRRYPNLDRAPRIVVEDPK